MLRKNHHIIDIIIVTLFSFVLIASLFFTAIIKVTPEQIGIYLFVPLITAIILLSSVGVIQKIIATKNDFINNIVFMLSLLALVSIFLQIILFL